MLTNFLLGFFLIYLLPFLVLLCLSMLLDYSDKETSEVLALSLIIIYFPGSVGYRKISVSKFQNKKPPLYAHMLCVLGWPGALGQFVSARDSW